MSNFPQEALSRLLPEEAVSTLAQAWTKDQVIIAIDGLIAAGKTTLAEKLSGILRAPVIHTDDFCIPFERKTPERLTQPGGNLDAERFRQEITLPLRQTGRCTVRPYRPHTDEWLEPYEAAGHVIIVEGSYSLHPDTGLAIDCRIFLTIGPMLQEKRIFCRNGICRLIGFRQKWIPLEQAYFAGFGLPDRACIIINGEAERSMTGKQQQITVSGKTLTYNNQRCRAWTHPYEYQHDGSDLSHAGCGIFSLCHCAEYLTGVAQDPEKWADFACEKGGRGDDGTDRPLLLHTLMAHGENTALGFRYEEDGLRNDLDTLYEVIASGKGVSMCNLRSGHIVALVEAREIDGVKQFLAIDSYSESADERVRNAVTEVIPTSEVTYPIKNAAGLTVGEGSSYGAFWVRADQPKDFNLLYRLP